MSSTKEYPNLMFVYSNWQSVLSIPWNENSETLEIIREMLNNK